MLIETIKLAVKVSLDIDDERAGNFIDELESLLSKYAEPCHKYRLNVLSIGEVNPDRLRVAGEDI